MACSQPKGDEAVHAYLFESALRVKNPFLSKAPSKIVTDAIALEYLNTRTNNANPSPHNIMLGVNNPKTDQYLYNFQEVSTGRLALGHGCHTVVPDDSNKRLTNSTSKITQNYV